MGKDIVITSTTETPAEMAAALSNSGGRAVIPEHPGRDDGGETEVEAAPVTEEVEEGAEVEVVAAAPVTPPVKKEPTTKEEPTAEGTSQARINRMRWEKGESDRTAAALTEENRRLQDALTKAGIKIEDTATAPPAAAAFPKPAPRIDDFETVEEFTTATAEWAVEKAEFNIEAKSTNRQQASTLNELEAAHYTRINEFSAANPDFFDVGKKAIDEGLPITKTMEGFFKRSTIGPAVMYRLAKDPDLCFEIASLSPAEQLVRLGEIQYEERGRTKSTTPEKVGTKDGGSAVTKASPSTVIGNPRPAPARPKYRAINPVSTTPSKTHKHPDDMTPNEYKEWRKNGGGKAPVAQKGT